MGVVLRCPAKSGEYNDFSLEQIKKSQAERKYFYCLLMRTFVVT